MRRRGIPYRVEDVDGDEGQRARVATLVAAGLPVSSALPVLDVRGTVTVGFNPCELENAWGKRAVQYHSSSRAAGIVIRTTVPSPSTLSNVI